MKTIQTFRMVFCCLTLITISNARGEVGPIGPTDGRITLYQLNGRCVLYTEYELRDKAKLSVIVMGDTFSVQPHGAMCSVVMSNVSIFETTYGRAPSNEVAQVNFHTDAYELSFPKNTKLIFNSSVVELPKAKIDFSAEANMKTYEGEDALRESRKLGLPPADFDVKKPTGRQK
jgi:hypothetical protein